MSSCHPKVEPSADARHSATKARRLHASQLDGRAQMHRHPFGQQIRFWAGELEEAASRLSGPGNLWGLVKENPTRDRTWAPTASWSGEQIRPFREFVFVVPSASRHSGGRETAGMFPCDDGDLQDEWPLHSGHRDQQVCLMLQANACQ